MRELRFHAAKYHRNDNDKTFKRRRTGYSPVPTRLSKYDHNPELQAKVLIEKFDQCQAQLNKKKENANQDENKPENSDNAEERKEPKTAAQ